MQTKAASFSNLRTYGMKSVISPSASGARERKVPVNGTRFAMEREALILRARAEHAKLAAQYATNEPERQHYRDRADAFELQASELEASLAG